jgi:hypothetical protein
MLAALRVLVLVADHPKLQSFVRLCAWSILSLRPKPPLAHYPAFIVHLATNSLKSGSTSEKTLCYRFEGLVRAPDLF